MPLPEMKMTFAPPTTRPSSFDDSDSEEEGVNDILAMLRSTNHSEKTPNSIATPKPMDSNAIDNYTVSNEKNSNATLPVRERTPSILSKGSSNGKAPNSLSSDSRRVKFDPAFDKPSRGVESSSKSNSLPSRQVNDSERLKNSQPFVSQRNEIASNKNGSQGREAASESRKVEPYIPQHNRSKQNIVNRNEAIPNELVAESRKISAGATIKERQSRREEVNSNEATQKDRSKREEVTFNAAPHSDNSMLVQFETPLSSKQQQHENNESYTHIMQQIATGQQSIQEICMGIKELQSTVAASTKDDGTSKSVENLIQGVSKSHEQLQELTCNFKRMMEEITTSNLEEKQNFIELQLSAENERKALMEEISNDKSKLAERWGSYEKDLELLRKQREDLEMDRKSILIEKDTLLKEQNQYQQNVALFEQRKIAAKDNLEHAEERIATAQQMDAKLQSELDKLHDLSHYVTRKDAEANDKLAEAEALFRKVQELESALHSDAEVIEEQKEQIYRDRNLLAQERMSVLKEKSLNRSGGKTPRCNNDAQFSSGMVRDNYSDIVLRKRLASINSQLSKLRED